MAVSKGKYLKTGPVPLLDLQSIILLKIDKSAGGRVTEQKVVPAALLSIQARRNEWLLAAQQSADSIHQAPQQVLHIPTAKRQQYFYILESVKRQ